MEIWKKMWVGVFFWTQCSDWFYIFYISQGSVVTQLMCGGMFCNHFMTNFPQNAPVKKFDIWLIFDKDMDKTLWLTYFGHPVDSVYRFSMFNTIDEPIGLHITLIALLHTFRLNLTTDCRADTASSTLLYSYDERICVFCVFFVLWVVFLYSFLLQYFDTVGWVFWPVKTVTHITYTVLEGM